MEETCPPRRAPGPPAWAVGLAALLLAAVLQGQAPRLVDVDGYYHARFAQELPDTGFRGFSAVRYGLWAEGFSDKEPLFHALLAPFTLALGTVPGAKTLVVLLNAALVLVAFLVLRSLGAAWPALLAFALPLASAHLLYRLQMPRAHLLSVVLFTGFLWALIRERRWWILGLSAAFTLSYTAFQLYLVLAAALAVSRSLRARAWCLRPLGWCAGGVALGLAVHPSTPHHLAHWWVQNVGVLSAAWGSLPPGVRLGPEFQAATTREWLLGAPFLLLAGWLAALWCLVRSAPRDDDLSDLFVLASLAAGLSMLSLRFVEYAIPAWVLLLGLFAARVRDGLGAAGRRGLAVLAALLGLGAAGNSLARVVPRMDQAIIYSDTFLEGFATQVGAGDTVFTCDWENVPPLYDAQPGARFLVMLDPTFLRAGDPDRFDAWVALLDGVVPDPVAAIRGVFDASRVVCPRRHPLTRQLLRDGATVLHGDRGQLLLALPPARAGEPGTPWEVAGPVHPAALEAQAAEPAFVPAPRPGWARELVLDPVFLTWPPVLEGPACFLARTRLQSPGAGAVLRLRTPVRPLFITLGNLRLTPAAGAWDDTAREGSWEGPAPEGLPPLVLGLCVDPDETPPPYGLGARLDVQADSATPTRHGVIRAGPASPGGPGPGSSR